MESGLALNSTEFWRFAQQASLHQLRYLVIGGLAMNFHGLIRNTIDSDVWIDPNPENIRQLKKVLISMDYEEKDFTFLERASEEVLVFSIEGPVDFLTSVHRSFRFDDCFGRAAVFNFQNTPIPVISLHDLRDIKVMARRPQDLRDAGLIDDFLSGQSR